MKTVFRKSFERDLKKIKDRPIFERVKQAIVEVEAATSLKASNVKKLNGAGGFYRIRAGEYRIASLLKLPKSNLYGVFIAARFTVFSHDRVCSKEGKSFAGVRGNSRSD